MALCRHLLGQEIRFSADEEVLLTPVSAEVNHISGVACTAAAVASWDYGESASCSISAAMGAVSWAVYR